MISIGGLERVSVTEKSTEDVEQVEDIELLVRLAQPDVIEELEHVLDEQLQRDIELPHILLLYEKQVVCPITFIHPSTTTYLEQKRQRVSFQFQAYSAFSRWIEERQPLNISLCFKGMS